MYDYENFIKFSGELAEWSNAAVLKTVEPKGSGGSNPSLSAIFEKPAHVAGFLLPETK